MQWSVVLRLLSRLYLAIAVAMLTAVPWAWFYDAMRVRYAFLIAAGVTLVISGLAYWRGRAPESIFPREALATVAIGWLSVGLLGSLPFLFCGVLTHPVPAIFESTSGFTTTGATVFSDVEHLPRAINWWRTMSHWLGGMGIVVLFIAILPRLGVGARHLFRSEVPGPITSDLRPKLRETASALWKIYLGLTLAEAALLYFAGMTPFEALCHSFATLATGGFSTRNASIGAYDSVPIELIVVFFMLLAGINFSLYHTLLSGRRWRVVVQDAELRVYLALVVISTLLVTAALVGIDRPLWTSLRQALFQVVAIHTTTGFGTDNFNVYPTLAKLLLVALMFVGGCAGSTGGGMKVVRFMILWKAVYDELYRTFRPQAVRSMKLGGSTVAPDIVHTALGFFAAGLGAFLFGSLFIASYGIDLVTACSSVIASLFNIGPGLGGVGSIENYGWLPYPVQIMLSLLMVLGRLELFTVLVLLLPPFWRR
jgi:trk system potassium uptake protein TrkH